MYMTKQEILNEFDDINFMYNDCSKYATLESLLDKYKYSIYAEIIKLITDKVECDGFERIVGEAIKNNNNYHYIEIY